MVLQPVLPMQEKTEYADVLTDRVRGPDGQPVRSPFPAVYHPSQESGIARLQAILADDSRNNYYGSIAGTGLDHVAFAWTFTTEPVQEDLMSLRDGIYGKGPFSYFANDFPPSSLQAFNVVGTTISPADETAGWQKTPACQKLLKTPFIVHGADVKPALTPFLQLLGKAFQSNFSRAQLDEFIAGLDEYVDYIVMGRTTRRT
jgi:hypothetical protein